MVIPWRWHEVAPPCRREWGTYRGESLRSAQAALKSRRKRSVDRPSSEVEAPLVERRRRSKDCTRVSKTSTHWLGPVFVERRRKAMPLKDVESRGSLESATSSHRSPVCSLTRRKQSKARSTPTPAFQWPEKASFTATATQSSAERGGYESTGCSFCQPRRVRRER